MPTRQGARYLRPLPASNVDADNSRATMKDPTNPHGKTYPRRLKAWENFSSQQHEIINQLLASGHPEEHLSEDLLAFNLSGRIKPVSQWTAAQIKRLLADEVHNPVFKAIRHLHAVDELGLPGRLAFGEPNCLSELAETVQVHLGDTATELSDVSHSCHVCAFISCSKKGHGPLAFLIEYIAPTTLTSTALEIGLRDRNIVGEVEAVLLEGATQCSKNTPYQLLHRLKNYTVAVALAQVFDDMIRCGLEYSIICTGLAFVFLRIDWKDPGTLYFHLDLVSSEKDLSVEYFTTTQVAAFAIRAMRSLPAGQDARASAKKLLPKCEETRREDASDCSSSGEETLNNRYSVCTPGTRERLSISHQNRPIQVEIRYRGLCPKSPIIIRPDETTTGPVTPQQSSPPTKRTERSPTPSDTPLYEPVYEPEEYCTQACLQSLVDGTNMDPDCPNAKFHCDRTARCRHRRHRHLLSCSKLMAKLRRQFARTLDQGCERTFLQGRRGVVFKVTLLSHGYVFVGKGTVEAFTPDLQNEFAVYERLSHLQGKCIPICLGGFELPRPYFYDFRVDVVYMLFMSWSGVRCDRVTNMNKRGGPNKIQMIREREMAVQALEAANVFISYPRDANVLWDHRQKCFMLIDFEKAEMDDESD